MLRIKQAKPAKDPTKYDDDMHVIISKLRVNPKEIVRLYKDDLDECLNSIPKKVWDDSALILRLLYELPELESFIKTLPKLNLAAYQKLVEINAKNLDIIPENIMSQDFINATISQNSKNIHFVPSSWRTYDTLDHFYSISFNEDSVEIIEDINSYAINLDESEEEKLLEKFGILSFVRTKLSNEQIEKAIEKNAFNIYTVPQKMLNESYAVKAITMNPEIALYKKIKLTDKIKKTFLNMIASMDKIKASALLNKALSPFIKMIQEYDKQVKIVKDWSFFDGSENYNKLIAVA